MALESPEAHHPLSSQNSILSHLNLGSHWRWGGIFSGGFISLGIAFLWMMLGGAVGMPSIDLFDPIPWSTLNSILPSPPLNRNMTGSWVYYLITLSLSFFVGSYCGSRLGRPIGALRSILCGVLNWAMVVVSTVAFVSLYTPVLSDLIIGIAPVSACWFAFAVLALGILASIAGGYVGRDRTAFPLYTEEGQGEQTLKVAS